MKIFLQLASCFLALYTFTLVDSTYMSWEEFKGKFKKSYSSREEDNARQAIFMARQALIIAHNVKYAMGSVTYKMGINKFSDLTDVEFTLWYIGTTNVATHDRTGASFVTFPDRIHYLPDNVNHVLSGAVTPVKDQKKKDDKCANGYAFSATGAIEAQHYMRTGELTPLSEQNIIDCYTNFTDTGCLGGDVEKVFDYVIENYGINPEESYHYEAKKKLCRFKRKNVSAIIHMFNNIPKDSENVLKEAVAVVGPISVAVDASNFMSYESGVFSDTACSKDKLNHGMLVVGYGIDNKTVLKYWLVKNSWGADWGENGYIRIARNADNMCGIAAHASFPIIV